jgi:hypothetical protein
VGKFIAVAVTIGAVTGLDAAGLNRFAAAFIGIAAGIAVLALLRFSNLGNRQHDPATDRAAASKPVSTKSSAKRSKGR